MGVKMFTNIKHFTGLILLVFVSTSYSQNISKVGTNFNLYERAVSACVAKKLKDYGTQGEETRLRFSERIFLYDDILTVKLPSQFGEVKVSYLTSDQLNVLFQSRSKQKPKTERTEIPFTTIQPMRNEGTTLIISLSDYWFSSKKHMSFHALEGGCVVSFNFDDGVDNFVVSKTELWGI
jgi:hypothetical protein